MNDDEWPRPRRTSPGAQPSSEGTTPAPNQQDTTGDAPTVGVSRDAVRRVGSLPRRGGATSEGEETLAQHRSRLPQADAARHQPEQHEREAGVPSDEATTQAGVRLPRSPHRVPLPQAPSSAGRSRDDWRGQPQPRPQPELSPEPSPPPPGAGAPPKPRTPRGLRRVVREIAVVLTVAVVLSLLVKTFLVQPFWIPSGSMSPTLVTGDRIVVSKLTPGPLDLQRGDVVVFEDPGHWLETPEKKLGPVAQALEFVGLYPAGDNHLVKRVIGMPGDRVVCCAKDGRLTVNGTAITEPYVQPGNKPSDLKFDVRVPRGKVWVMGDHRSNSADSRFHDQNSGGRVGSVPIDDITGRAVLVVWPLGRMGGIGNHSSTFDKVTDP